MSKGPHRALIPAAFCDLKQWPKLKSEVLEDPVKKAYERRVKAIENYTAGTSYAQIWTDFGVSKTELRRLIKRCLTIAVDGLIFGFRALAPGVRTAGYDRAAPVNHTIGSGSGGCAGSLTLVFARFPELEIQLQDMFFGRVKGDPPPEKAVKISEIHDQFKKELRRLGFTDSDWPFSTANCGYKSLATYFRKLLLENIERAMPSRLGIAAAQRRGLGSGHLPTLPVLRPYSFVQLDYEKVDAASVFIFKNDYGEEFEVPLARWHFGFICEGATGGALGYCLVLALNPSADEALEAVQSALFPATTNTDAVQVQGKDCVLIHELILPLAYQCFAAIQVDNAWCNAANDVPNNIIDVVGAAVAFGPVREWWHRSLIERVFGALSERGLKRLPSSYGSGPDDPKVQSPNAAASRFRIGINDLVYLFRKCMREHNQFAGERNQWTSPVRRLTLALANPASGLFPQPLPQATQRYCPLMMHMEFCTVRGNVNKAITPYFNLDRNKHRNPKLAQSPWLIGEELVVYVDRRCARLVYAAVKGTGEDLGQMIPEGPWRHSNASWRDRKLINRAGMTLKYRRVSEDPMDDYRQFKIEQLQSLPKSKRRKSSKDALELARLDLHALNNKAIPQDEEFQLSAETCEPKTDRPDRLGLLSVPDIETTERGADYE